jgi:hypothetical protein
MKYIIILLSLFVIGGISNTTLAQKGQKDKAVVEREREGENTVLDDPKLSAEDIEQMKIAGQDNPAKIKEGLDDPKMDASEIPDEVSYGKANAKANPIVERDEANPAEAVRSVISVPVNTQPEGEKSDAKPSINRKTSNDQPEGKQPANKVVTLKKSGSNTQPEGKNPNGN